MLSRQRRSFLSILNTRMAALAAMAAGGAALSRGQSKARWEPARHEKDDWLDELPGRHRLVFDATTPEGFGEALAFAGNFLRVNRTEYGLTDGDLAVVIVARHRAAAFAFGDAMWAKYSEPIGGHAGFQDPKTGRAPSVNLYNAPDDGRKLANRGTTADSILKRGVQLAVCSTATMGFAGEIAQKTGANASAIFRELTGGLLMNSRMVPAGIVTVSRAQERGYSMVKA